MVLPPLAVRVIPPPHDVAHLQGRANRLDLAPMGAAATAALTRCWHAAGDPRGASSKMAVMAWHHSTYGDTRQLDGASE